MSTSPPSRRDQLTRSLSRLQQERLDVFLLHNPEYYLTDALREGQPHSQEEVEARRAEMLRRVYEVGWRRDAVIACAWGGWCL
jgi:aryl-alcohol dehydrogenase-like predicted oxidoreductase